MEAKSATDLLSEAGFAFWFDGTEAMPPGSILDAINTGLMLADARQPDMPIVYMNRSAEAITGYRTVEMIGKNCRFLQGAERQQPEIETIRTSIKAGQASKVILKNFRKNGSPFWNQVQLIPLFDDEQKLTHYLSVFADVTNYREALAQAEISTRFDPLTGLPNRQGAREELSALLARRRTGELAVATCEIKGLRDINNTFGIEVGDALLRLAANRLKSLPSIDCTARLSSGRFLLVIQAADSDGILAVAKTALEALEQPYMVLGTALCPPAVCGYTLLERRLVDAETLLREASIASTGAQPDGGGSIRQFNASADAAAKTRLRLMSEIQNALRNDEFVLHYQPKINVGTGTIVGAEALLRWQHPLFGLQLPGRFLPLVEKSNLIIDIGRLTLAQAARFAARINGDRTVEPLCVAVNISPIHFRRDDFAPDLAILLEENGCRPEWLSLELVETVLAETTPGTMRTFTKLREMGIGIAVDDFGVGYSNLIYLRDLPLTELKIDQTFVRHVDSRPDNAMIVRAVSGLAREFGLSVVAEGVESQTEHEAILNLGCNLGQGFHYNRPLEAADFLRLIVRQEVLTVSDP